MERFFEEVSEVNLAQNLDESIEKKIQKKREKNKQIEAILMF